jgi:putative transposase
MTCPPLIHDRLALPRNHDVCREAIAPNPSSGYIKVFDAQSGEHELARAEMYMSPIKLKRVKDLDVDHDINAYGKPDQLVFDDGHEVMASRMQNLKELVVHVKFCKARSGHTKPFIERLNRSLKAALEGAGK